MKTIRAVKVLCLLTLSALACVGVAVAAAPAEPARMPEVVYQGPMAAFPGPWSFAIPKQGIILVRDDELETLANDPDKMLDLSLTPHDKNVTSLRKMCEAGKQQGARTLIVAFDHFFQQYRSGQDTVRRLMPDTDAYIERIARIGKFAEQYGLGLELSLLTPLELGRGYRAATGETGVWMQYRKALRDPQTGAFSVELWRHTRWTNNKGPFDIEDAGVRAFAFREHAVHGSPYRVVPEESITEITDQAKVEVLGNLRAEGFPAMRIRVHGVGGARSGGLNRVLVVQMYRTPEMDFFSEKAMPFLRGLIDRYTAAGIRLNALYSDEPHLMGDWSYHRHHDHGQFAMRYVTPAFAEKFAATFGAKYRDFAKYLVYFTYGQEDSAVDLSANEGTMHVFGATPAEIRRTALFRAHYYRFLQDGLADALVEAKHYAESKMGRRLEARAHATWAESPTCDYWRSFRGVNAENSKYEYTSDFVWSNTVQQSAVACSDYFRWGDFLTGNGNDHAEGGFLDRNYTGLTLACSTGILNEVPYSYGAHWGMPGAISHRRSMVATAFGVAGSHFGEVQDMQHRDVDVLMLYPIDLVAVEEKYGSWMTQYSYANYVTAAKLLERGKVAGGAIEMAGRRFTTVAITFEPFPSKRLLAMLTQLVEQGGRVVWSGPPPVLCDEASDATAPWSKLFGVEYRPEVNEGIPAPGRKIVFEGRLDRVPPQIILTHELVDRIYPVTPVAGTQAVAKVQRHCIATHRRLAAGGSATFLGFRPRDNQSCSLGYDTRTWFDVLSAVGAYPSSGKFAGVQDNTEAISRTGEHIVCRFPNGAVTIARHLRLLEEDWEGGFARNPKSDAQYEASHRLPPDDVRLQDAKLSGHAVSYQGAGAMAFRVDPQGNLIAFAGHGCREIAVDGRKTVFADAPLPFLMFAPVHAARRVPGGASHQAVVHGAGDVRIPAAGMPQKVKCFTQGATLGSKDSEVTLRRDAATLILKITPAESGRQLWIVPEADGASTRVEAKSPKS